MERKEKEEKKETKGNTQYGKKENQEEEIKKMFWQILVGFDGNKKLGKEKILYRESVILTA